MTVAWSGRAIAEPTWTPYASAQAEYNSNLFDLSGADQALAENGDSQLSDIAQRYLAGVDLRLPLGGQLLRASVEGRRFEFVHFSRLDHNEYLLTGGLDWRWNNSLDSTLAYRQEQRMASFADRSATDLALETEHIGSGSLNLDIDPEWRLETGVRTHELDSPLPDAPDFKLTENAVHAALEYQLAEAVAAGVYAEYLDGQFDGVADAASFQQKLIALTANYAVADLENFRGQLGYTLRHDNSGEANTLTALTGMLDYHRQLSGKTTAGVQLFRRVDSYVGGASAEQNTGVDTNLVWLATAIMSLSADYQWFESRFSQAVSAESGPARKDHGQILNLRLAYQMTPWLALRPYFEYQLRSSNIETDNFHAAIAGIELRARFD